jgi:hypothetical protein
MDTGSTSYPRQSTIHVSIFRWVSKLHMCRIIPVVFTPYIFRLCSVFYAYMVSWMPPIVWPGSLLVRLATSLRCISIILGGALLSICWRYKHKVQMLYPPCWLRILSTLKVVFCIFYLPGTLIGILNMKSMGLRGSVLVGGLLTTIGAFLRVIGALFKDELGTWPSVCTPYKLI